MSLFEIEKNGSRNKFSAQVRKRLYGQWCNLSAGLILFLHNKLLKSVFLCVVLPPGWHSSSRRIESRSRPGVTKQSHRLLLFPDRESLRCFFNRRGGRGPFAVTLHDLETWSSLYCKLRPCLQRGLPSIHEAWKQRGIVSHRQTSQQSSIHPLKWQVPDVTVKHAIPGSLCVLKTINGNYCLLTPASVIDPVEFYHYIPVRVSKCAMWLFFLISFFSVLFKWLILKYWRHIGDCLHKRGAQHFNVISSCKVMDSHLWAGKNNR